MGQRAYGPYGLFDRLAFVSDNGAPPAHLAPGLVRLVARFELPEAASHDEKLLPAFNRDVFGAMLDKFFQQARAFGTHSEVESIHDLRVLARRVAEYLEIVAPVAPEALLLTGQDTLQRLMKSLGPVRNADVSRGLLHETLQLDLSALERDALLHLDQVLHKRREKRLRQAVELAAREDSREGLVQLAQLRRALARTARATRRAFARALAGHVHRRSGEMLAHLRKEAALSTDDDLHALRIALRRMRYTGEATRKVARHPKLPDVERVRKILRVMGAHHDLAVLVERIGKVSAKLGDKHEPKRVKAGLERLARRFAARRDARLRAFHRLVETAEGGRRRAEQGVSS